MCHLDHLLQLPWAPIQRVPPTEAARREMIYHMSGGLRLDGRFQGHHGCSTIDRGYLFITIDEMRNREFLGQHELMVILAVMRLGREAYGVPIAAEIAQRTGREMLQGSVYAILERLESKGFVTSRLGAATLQRGGRAKRYFALTAEGSRQVRATQRALESLWQGLPKTAGISS
jgi:DNA-binding PadR family transcriptional regulator